MLVEVDDFGVLLKTQQDIEIRPFAPVERDGLLDVIGDAGAFLGAVENDADRERPFADYRLIGSGDSDEVWKIYDLSLGRLTPFSDDNRVERDLYCADAILAFEVRLAQQAVERDILRAALRRRPEHGCVGERPQHDRARASL